MLEESKRIKTKADLKRFLKTELVNYGIRGGGYFFLSARKIYLQSTVYCSEKLSII